MWLVKHIFGISVVWFVWATPYHSLNRLLLLLTILFYSIIFHIHYSIVSTNLYPSFYCSKCRYANVNVCVCLLPFHYQTNYLSIVIYFSSLVTPYIIVFSTNKPKFNFCLTSLLNLYHIILYYITIILYRNHTIS